MPDALPALLERTIDPDVARAVDAAPNRVNEFGFDPWGFSPQFAKLGYSFGKRVLLPYFRPEVHGIENVPEGRVLLVPNHSGQLPWDGVLIALVMILHGKPPRAVRAMVERAFPAMPFVNEVLIRGGAVLGDPVNCKNLLEDEQARKQAVLQDVADRTAAVDSRVQWLGRDVRADDEVEEPPQAREEDIPQPGEALCTRARPTRGPARWVRHDRFVGLEVISRLDSPGSSLAR